MSLLDLANIGRQSTALRRRTGWIGVEVGSGAIKIAQVERIAGRCRIARSLVVRAGENCPFDLASLEDGRVGQEIRQALALHGGFRGRLAACALSMRFCELRTLVSAKGTEDEQRELISLELDDAPSGGAEPREFDFWDAAQGPDDEQGMTQVHVLSIPRTLADSVGNNLLQAGLRCQVLDGIPFTSLRAVDMSEPGGAAKDAVVLDWDHSTATLIVIRDGAPLLTRTLRDCGLQQLLEKINQHIGLSSVESEALLTSYGVESSLSKDAAGAKIQRIITDLGADLLKKIVDELQETLAFVKLRFAGLTPEKIWLGGAGSATAHIAERLEMQTSIPTGPLGLPGRLADPDQPPSVLANAAALSALAWES